MQVNSGEISFSQFAPGETGQDTQPTPNVYLLLDPAFVASLGGSLPADKVLIVNLSNGQVQAPFKTQGMRRVKYKAVPE